MLKLRLQDWMLPGLMLAFVGSTITFLTPIFNTTSRWAVLGVVVTYVLLTRNLLQLFLSSLFGLWTLLFALWIGTTVIWSEVPMISGIKFVAFVMIAFSCMAVGQVWIRQHALQASLNYLLPLTVAAMLAGVLGRFSEDSTVFSGPTTMTQGLVLGPNMFGSLLAMCFPLLLWQIYSRWSNRRQLGFWIMLMSIDLYYLFASASRAAMLVVLCIVLAFFLSLSVNRKVHLLFLAIGALITTFIISPGQFSHFEEVYVFKGSKGEGILHTRETVWEESLEAAENGGLIGLGYGVSFGETNFRFDISSVGYGREKGNTQMAIVEEAGLVGLFIYLASILALGGRVGMTLLRSPRGPYRMLLSLVAGTLLGMVVHSIFEAWWVAPGSPESVYFWTLAGVALGLTSTRPIPATSVLQAGSTLAGRMPAQRPGRPVSV